jgi:superfamily II RNA helicase
MYSEINKPTSSIEQCPVAQGDTIIFSYRGVFREQTSTHILNWIERYINSNSAVTRPESKKIFKVAVELIQNLIHHSSTPDSLFVFSKSESENRFSLCSTNLVDTKQSDELVSALCVINAISEDELRSLKKSVMIRDSRSEHGGGGMGLLELAKLSNGNIKSELLPSQQDKLLFCLSVHLKPIKA